MSRAPIWLRISGVLVVICTVMFLLSAELERRSESLTEQQRERLPEPGLPRFRELPELAMEVRPPMPYDTRLELVFLSDASLAQAEPCLLDLRENQGRMGGMARRLPQHASTRLAIVGGSPRAWSAAQSALFLASIEEVASRQGLCLSDLILPPELAAELQPLLVWLRIPARRSQS